jgi:hypothetical protein
MLIEYLPRRPRRYLRFSLRGTIALILLLGALLGWLVRRAHIQRDAVAAIERAGGTVYYDWQWKNGTYLGSGQPWAPRWLVDFLGDDYFGHVTYVSVTLAPDEVDLVMTQLERLTQVERVSLARSPVGDVRLARIRGLDQIEYLDLSSTRITDDGLVNLAGLRNLSTLLLRRTFVTEGGAQRLKQSLPGVTIFN